MLKKLLTTSCAAALTVFTLLGGQQSKPFKDTPQTIPGLIKATHFDFGGEGVAYHDKTPQNTSARQPGSFRSTEGVDCSAHTVGYVFSGEWLTYTVNVTKTQEYDAILQYGRPNSYTGPASTIFLYIDGKQATTFTADKGTGPNWGPSGKLLSNSSLKLSQGEHKIKVLFEGGSVTFSGIKFQNAPQVRKATNIPKPKKIKRSTPKVFSGAPAKEFSPRAGLPNFFSKLKTGQQVKIAYLGGSITAQKGWRILSREWFQKKYPNAKVEEINAAIGGTGSDLGVFRLEHDVLRFKPDLLFIEFAVNDSWQKPQKIRKAMEGIIRRTWKDFPDCDICFVYTITHKSTPALQNGKMNRSATTMEKLADHYNIPTIHMGYKIALMEKEGKLDMKAPMAKMEQVSGDELNKAAKLPQNANGKIPFSKDGVHPYTNTGHQLYLDSIIRSMDKITDTGKASDHKLIPPLEKNNMEHAKMFPLEKGERKGEWIKLHPGKNRIVKRFKKNMPSIWLAKPGATLKFKFKGTHVAIYDLLGPGCGNLEIKIDGNIPRKVKRIDGYSTYYRLGILNIASNLPDKVHTVEINVLADKLDKTQIIHKHRQKIMKKRPEKFKPTDWYAGGIFVIGEII